MMQKRRGLSLCLALILVFSVLLVTASAAGITIYFKGVSGTNYIVNTSTDTLKEGISSNIKINLVQNMLKQRSMFPYTVDGSFGPQTKAQVIYFQNYYGLSGDGVVGEKTWIKFADIFVNVTLTPINGM